LADGRLLTRIWNVMVRSEPDEPPIGFELVDAAEPPLGRPSGRMAKPEGRRGMYEVSSPLMTMSMECRLTGAYTRIEPDASVQLS